VKHQLSRLLMTIILLFEFNLVFGQSDNGVGNWDVLILKGNLSKKFSLVGEFNIRNNNFHSTYDYSEYKIGIAYSLTQNFALSIGTGGYNTSLTGSFLTTQPSQKEYRTWLDLLFKNSYKRLNFDHRLRIEQRFTSAGYKNRVRYRLTLTIPVNKPTLSANTFFLASSNEFFVGQSHPNYEKNRFYVGTGYKLNQNFTFHIGNMHQSDFKSSSSISKNYIQLMVIYNLTHKIEDKHLSM
jgi:hypothetical protein